MKRHASAPGAKCSSRWQSTRNGPTLLGETLNQHIAIAVDTKLVSVPSIDYRQYPVGVNGDDRPDLGGNLTTESAKDLAILLRYGPLPVQLTATG